jgi:hypothetical protein
MTAWRQATYVYVEWKQCRVGVDYHVEVDKHFYSVAHMLLHETMWARITARTVEVFHHGQRVAVHVRSSSDRKHTTVRDHMPSSAGAAQSGARQGRHVERGRCRPAAVDIIQSDAVPVVCLTDPAGGPAATRRHARSAVCLRRLRPRRSCYQL